MRPATILGADWSKHERKRAVYVADVQTRTIRRVAEPRWGLDRLLSTARALPGPVLVGLDLVLGLPRAYLGAACATPTWRGCSSFLEWLSAPAAAATMFDIVDSAAQWRVETPFFRVPPGQGSLSAYAKAAGYPLLREIDKATGAKPPFVVSGIPGTVGSGTRSLWQELRGLLGAPRGFALWPFEGPLHALLGRSQVVLAECYPAIAYTAAMCAPLPHRRLRVAKTKLPNRRTCLTSLRSAAWIAQHGVELQDLDAAEHNEDDFDALMFAAAALRSVLDEMPLADETRSDANAEGGMLLLPAIDLSKPAISQATQTGDRPARRTGSARPRRSEQRFLCPIECCEKVFRGGRGGWDSHVGSLRQHPNWHPELRSPTERKTRFRLEYARWF